MLREHQAAHLAAFDAAARARSADPFLGHLLEMLQLALGQLAAQLRGRPETAEDRLAQARRSLAKRWFSRQGYLALFPELSTASASRDLAAALATRSLNSRGQRRSTEYRFR